MKNWGGIFALLFCLAFWSSVISCTSRGATASTVAEPVQQIYLYAAPMTNSEMEKAEQKLEMFRQYNLDKEDPRRSTNII